MTSEKDKHKNMIEVEWHCLACWITRLCLAKSNSIIVSDHWKKLDDKYTRKSIEKNVFFEKEALSILTQIRYFYILMPQWITQDTYQFEKCRVRILGADKVLLLLKSFPDL